MSTSSTFNLGLVNNRLGVLSDQIVNLGPYNGLDSTSTTAALAASQGKALYDNVVMFRRNLTSDDNLDNIVTSGIYYLDGNPTNIPSSGEGYGILTVFNISSYITLQVYYRPSKIYVRRYRGSWDPWKSVALT